MTLGTRPRSRSPVSEEAAAAARVVLAFTVVVGLVAAVMGAASGALIVIEAIPTLALLLAIALGAVPIAGWAGVVVWAVLLPSADGEALLAPIAMMVLCLAIAISPERLTSWIHRDLAASPRPDGRQSGVEHQPEGWIEENGHLVD